MTDINVLRARQEALEIANDTLHDAFRTMDGDAHLAFEVGKQHIKLMSALRATQLAHGEAIAGLVVEVADVKSDLAEFRTEVNGRLGALERDVDVLKGDVGDLIGDVAVLKADVSVLKSDVSVLKSDMAVLKADVGVLKDDVSVLKSDMVEVKAGLTEVLRRLPA